MKTNNSKSTIYKYQIQTTDEQTIRMPKGSRVLCVQIQRKVPCIWVQVDPEATLVDTVIHVHGTGHPMPEVMNRQYVGSYQMNFGDLVFHVFHVDY